MRVNHLSLSGENSINYEKSVNKQQIKLVYIYLKIEIINLKKYYNYKNILTFIKLGTLFS
jgi:hypothetical protein